MMSNRISISLVFLFAVLFGSSATAQDKPIKLRNPSFGGVPHRGGEYLAGISGWESCANDSETPPDIQPNLNPFQKKIFGVTKKAYHDSTYLGMVVRANDTYESVGQRLRRPLEKGKCYEFSAHLARSEQYVSPNPNNKKVDINHSQPVIIRVWGGIGFCTKRELLAETEPIKNFIWKKYKMKFEPTEDHRFIVIEAFYKVPSLKPYNGNVLVDNLSDIVPVPCDELPVDEPIEDEPIASVDNFPVGSSKVNQSPKDKVEEKIKAEEPKVEEYSYTSPKKEVKRKPIKKKRTLQGIEHRKLRRGQTIQINRLYFAVDDSTINESSYKVLDEISEFMKEHQGLIVEIRGHTNGNCDTQFCDQLSLARAKAVANYLRGKGIVDNRLGFKGYGKRKPIASNRSAHGRKKNRRVELKILSLDG